MPAPTPAIPSFVAGPATSAGVNALAANETNLYNFTLGGFRTAPPFVIVNATAGQVYVAAAEVSATFNAAVVNTDAMWVASTPAQLTINTAGTYLFTAQVVFGNGAVAAYDYIGICVNGTGAANRINTQAYTSSASSVAGPTLATSVSYTLSAGATVFLRFASSVNQTLGTGNLLNTSLTALWASP